MSFTGRLLHSRRMNLTDRIYLAVHVLLTVLVCIRHETVAGWWIYVVWNVAAIVAIVVVVQHRDRGNFWEFVHDWLPLVFFTSVFEEISFLAMTIWGEWQNRYLIAWEAWLFPVLPSELLHRHSTAWFAELLEFGYFTFYLLYPVVAGVLWAWRKRVQFTGAFRRLTDALSVGYVACYVAYLLFPTRSPSHDAGLAAVRSTSDGAFHALVQVIQAHAGVHGNAFPSAHIMLAFVVLLFVMRYLPRVALPLSVCVLLMCVGAVYDGYHYAIDVLAGALVGIAASFLMFIRRASEG